MPAVYIGILVLQSREKLGSMKTSLMLRRPSSNVLFRRSSTDQEDAAVASLMQIQASSNCNAPFPP